MRAFQVQCEDFKLKKDPNIIKEREEAKGKLRRKMFNKKEQHT